MAILTLPVCPKKNQSQILLYNISSKKISYKNSKGFLLIAWKQEYFIKKVQKFCGTYMYLIVGECQKIAYCNIINLEKITFPNLPWFSSYNQECIRPDAVKNSVSPLWCMGDIISHMSRARLSHVLLINNLCRSLNNSSRSTILVIDYLKLAYSQELCFHPYHFFKLF